MPAGASASVVNVKFYGLKLPAACQLAILASVEALVVQNAIYLSRASSL